MTRTTKSHSFRHQHEPCTSACSLVAVQTQSQTLPSAPAWGMDTITALGGSTMGTNMTSDGCSAHSHQQSPQWQHSHSHQHGFRVYHKPQTSTCDSVITWAMDINTGPRCHGTTESDTTLHSSTYWTSLWPQVAGQALHIIMANS